MAGAGRRPPRYDEACFGCGARVPQATPAALCDYPSCVHLKCLQCHPDMGATLECPEHQGHVAHLEGPGGVQTFAAAVAPQPVPRIPDGAEPALSTLFAACAVMLAVMVATSAAAVARAHRFFTTFLRFFNVAPSEVTPWVVMAYLIARCRPPVGVPLPAFMTSRVLPRTAAGDLTLLRRRARIVKDHALLVALTDEDVLRLGAVLGANVRRSKTAKAPVLIHHLEAMWAARAVGALVMGFVRNALMLVVGLVCGLRRREIVALRVCDAVWDAPRAELTVRICRDKTNQTVTDAQQPRVLCVAHALLTEVMGAWRASALGQRAAGSTAPLFPRLAGNVITDATLDPGTVNSIVRQMLPGLPVSPHGLRVGFATELYAAGVDVSRILEMGRWSSMAGLLYVLPSADATAAATRSMGSGGVAFDRVLLQRALRAGERAPVVRPAA